MIDWIRDFWPEIAGIAAIGLAIVVTADVVLHKRNERAAVGWVGVTWLNPFVGAVAYLMLGVNRIKRRAVVLRPERQPRQARAAQFHAGQEALAKALQPDHGHLTAIAGIVAKVAEMPLLAGNSVRPLENGDEAYPEMLAAIDAAEHTVALGTYIFNRDNVGLLFAAALERAVRRGAEVRVLIDGIGSYYSLPPIVSELRRRGITVERFLHSFVPWRMPYLNLRNHQKILVVDGRIGFTGGMNIRRENYMAFKSRSSVQDLQFRIEGPVVTQMMQIFAEDWRFTCGETLQGDSWFPEIPPCGHIFVRGIYDGPDEEADRLRWTILGALVEARTSIQVVTPYFLPDESLITALRLAALRGVEIDIVLPEKNNMAFIAWAAMANLDQLIEAGCRVWQSPPPFDHSKVMLVDGAWALVGSTNWDPRSLRLNFEFDVECYSRELGGELHSFVQKRIAASRPITMEHWNERSLPVKLRDGIARLFSPYL